MARTFGERPVTVSIGMTAYLLTLAVFIPGSSWMADRFGSKTVFGSAILVFTLGSILCGASNSLPEFVGARILQAVGGAMMLPVGRLAVLRTAEKHELLRTMQYITMPGLIAPVLGPPWAASSPPTLRGAGSSFSTSRSALSGSHWFASS